MAYSFDFIFGAASIEGRKARSASLPGNTIEGVAYGHKGFVVVAEYSHGVYQELDADSAEHGERLADLWVNEMKTAICASVWEVKENGGLGKRTALVTETVIII